MNWSVVAVSAMANSYQLVPCLFNDHDYLPLLSGFFASLGTAHGIFSSGFDLVTRSTCIAHVTVVSMCPTISIRILVTGPGVCALLVALVAMPAGVALDGVVA
jgi:hypothetical protein